MIPRFEPPYRLKKNKFQNRLFLIKSRLCFDKQRNLLFRGYNYGLLSLEPGIIYLPQLKTLYKILVKYIKPRRRLSRRKKAEISRTSSAKTNKAIKNVKKRKRKYERILLSIFPNVAFTKKGLGTRMGKGKGNIANWGMRIRAGRCLFQIKSSIMERHALKALRQVAFRLPILTRLLLKKRDNLL